MAEIFHDMYCYRCKQTKDKGIRIPFGKHAGEFLCTDCGNEIWDAIMNMEIPDDEESEVSDDN